MDVVRTMAGLLELRSTWDAIATPWGSPMQGHDWVRTCAEVFGLDRDLSIVVARSPRAASIAPLFWSRSDGRLELIGPPQVPEAGDVVHSDPSEVANLARAVVKLRAPLWISRLLAESPLPDALRRAHRGFGVVITRPAPGCPWIALDPSWTDPEHKMEPRKASALRRGWRIAEEMGTVKTEVLTPTPEEVGRSLDEAYAVEREGWKGGEGSALARSPLQGEFYRRFAVAACERRTFRLLFLRIGGRAAAMQLAAVTGGRFWLLKIGYSEAFSRCSPGTLLVSESIRYAAGEGLGSYEFLGTEEPWIRAWTSTVRPCVSLWSYPIGLRGGIALARDAAASVRRRVGAVPWGR